MVLLLVYPLAISIGTDGACGNDELSATGKDFGVTNARYGYCRLRCNDTPVLTQHAAGLSLVTWVLLH